MRFRPSHTRTGKCGTLFKLLCRRSSSLWVVLLLTAILTPSFAVLSVPSSASTLGGSPSIRTLTIPTSPGSDYPTYLGGVERDSASSDPSINLTSVHSLHVLWGYNVKNNQVESQPVEANGSVFFGANNGYEYSLYATNGTLRWKTFLGVATNDTPCGFQQGVTSTATIAGSTLYVEGGYPYFYSLNSSTGQIEWRASIAAGGAVYGLYDWSSPLIYNGNAYVGIASQCDVPLVPAGLDEFSLTTHLLVNFFNTSAPEPNGSSIWGSPAVNPTTNTIYIATGNAYESTSTPYSESIIALNATTLAVKASWQVPAAQRVVRFS